MVTKQYTNSLVKSICLILAKIHMVTKLNEPSLLAVTGLILAKIHMVTKRRIR